MIIFYSSCNRKTIFTGGNSMSGKRRIWLVVMGTAMTIVGYRAMVNGATGIICGILAVEPEN